MNLLNKLIIKDLKLNKKRSIVTIIGIALSIALLMAVLAMYSSAIKSLANFQIRRKGNFHVAFLNVPKEDLEIFENNKSIEEIYRVADIGYAKIKSKNKSKPYVFLKSFSKEALNNMAVNLKKGRMPRNNKEILIPSHLETNGRVFYDVLDTITLNIGERVDKNGKKLSQKQAFEEGERFIPSKKETYKIVGVIERPSIEIEDYLAPGYTIITVDDKEFQTYDVYAKFNKSKLKDIYKVTASLIGIKEDLFNRCYKEGSYVEDEEVEIINHSKYKILLNTLLIDLETNPFQAGTIKELTKVVIVVLIIIIVTSVYCIKNSFEISSTEKIKEYGMLRSIGATKNQIKKSVFYEASILGLIGIPLGIILGILSSYILIIVSNYLLKDSFNGSGFYLVFSVNYLYMLGALLLGIVTIYLSAFRSALKASRVSPIESIRNIREIKLTAKSLKCPKIVSSLFGIGGEISYKNTKRNKKKYRTTVVSLIISVATFIALSGFVKVAYNSAKSMRGAGECNLVLYNHELDNAKSNQYKIVEQTTKLDGVEKFSINREQYLRLENAKFNSRYLDFSGAKNEHIIIMALGKDNYQNYLNKLGLKYSDTKGKGILLDYALAISHKNSQDKKMIREFSYKKGDILSGKVDGSLNVNIEIAYIAKEKPFSLEGKDESLLLVSDEYFDNHLETNFASICFKAKNPNELQKDIEKLFDSYEEKSNYSMNNIDEQYNSSLKFLTLVGIFLYGFIIVVSLIGITNIFNTITSSVNLRSKEFAMLKSIGMTKKEFKKMISLESIFIGSKSLLIGIPFGLTLYYLIYSLMLKANPSLQFVISIWPILLVIVLVFLLIIVLMKYSVSKINKQDIIETIRKDNI